MDGVLIDSEPLHLESTSRLLRESFGVEFGKVDNLEFLGTTDRRMFEVLRERHSLAPDVEELITRRKAIYLEIVENQGLPWREGIRDLIPYLTGEGYRLAVASSGLRRIVEHTLRTGDLLPHFEAVVTGDDVRTPKPSPEIYLEAARQLALPPSSCIAIEDTDVGVRAAKAAGMRAIAFPTVTTAGMDFGVADWVMGHTREIRELLSVN